MTQIVGFVKFFTEYLSLLDGSSITVVEGFFNRITYSGENQMSLDRVVVGGGHFVERGGQMVQELVERGPNLLSAFERAQERLSYASNVPVAPRVYTFQQASQHLQSNRPPIILCEAGEGNDNNWFDRNDPGGASGPDAADQFQTALEGWNEALLSIGSATAGDMEGAVDHGAQAVEKWWENFSQSWSDLFGGGNK